MVLKYAQVLTPEWVVIDGRKLILTEIFARTIKNIFRENLRYSLSNPSNARLMARSVTEQSFVPFTDVAVAMFGKVMETDFWLEEILPLANTCYSIKPSASPEELVEEIYKHMEADPEHKVQKAIVNNVCTLSLTVTKNGSKTE